MICRNKELGNLIKTNYTLTDLMKIEKFFETHNTLKFVIKENGLYPASLSASAESVSGYAHTWLRDTIMITNYQMEIGNYDQAQKTINTLRDYFYKNSFRFRNIIEGKADKNDPMQRPHVRFNSDTMEEIDQKWAHAQNDALGYALWMAFKLCNKNQYNLSPIDLEVWSIFPFYFEAIEFWKDQDSGHWEETRKVESSSIGVVVAALEEMKKYLEGTSQECFAHDNKKVTTQLLDKLIRKGRNKLNQFLPYESPPRRKADGALLFLIYPLNIVNQSQSQKILDLILKNLECIHGIKRYIGDSYWCADYKKLLKTEERTVDFSNNIGQRDKLLKHGEEAQWCIFDPLISVIYGRRYLITKKPKYHLQQVKYFNRSLCQLTEEKCRCGGGKCPEAYYIENTKKGEYVPNDHTPLAWTQANLGVSFEYLKRSLELKDNRR